MDKAQARATLVCPMFVERAGHSVHLHTRSFEFGTVVCFAGACLFVLVPVDIFLPNNYLAFIAVSAGATKTIFAGRPPSGRLHIYCHHQSSGLSNLPTVTAATAATVCGANSTATNGIARNARGAGHPDLSGDDERLRGVRAFPQITGAGTPRHRTGSAPRTSQTSSVADADQSTFSF